MDIGMKRQYFAHFHQKISLEAVNFSIVNLFIKAASKTLSSNIHIDQNLRHGWVFVLRNLQNKMEELKLDVPELVHWYQALESDYKFYPLVEKFNQPPTSDSEVEQNFVAILDFYKSHLKDEKLSKIVKNFIQETIYRDFKMRFMGESITDITKDPFWALYNTNLIPITYSLSELYKDLHAIAKNDKCIAIEMYFHYLLYLKCVPFNLYDLGVLIYKFKANPSAFKLPKSFETKLSALNAVDVWFYGATTNTEHEQRNKCCLVLARQLWRQKLYTQALDYLAHFKDRDTIAADPEVLVGKYLYTLLSPHTNDQEKCKVKLSNPQPFHFQNATPGMTFDDQEKKDIVYLEKSRFERAKIWMSQHDDLTIRQTVRSIAARVAVVALKVTALVGATFLIVASGAAFPWMITVVSVPTAIVLVVFGLSLFWFARKWAGSINWNVLGNPDDLWFPA
jgi:hypothetical protein